MEQKINVAGISIITSLILTLGKLVAGFATSSVSVLASGIHSLVDLLAASLTYFSVNQSQKPADEDHPYGHGKYANVAAVFEALLIGLLVAFILYRSITGLFQSNNNIRFIELGIAVTGVSALINLLISRMLAGAFRRTLTEDFAADYRHTTVNAVTSAAVCLGLVVTKYTGYPYIDSMVAGFIALALIREGYLHLKNSVGGIMDVRLSPEEEEAVKSVLAHHSESYVQYHALRTRRSGPNRYVDLHLVVPRDQVIAFTHALCDRIEKDVHESLPGVQVLIHAEPCRPISGECKNCGIEEAIQSGKAEVTDCRARYYENGFS